MTRLQTPAAFAAILLIAIALVRADGMNPRHWIPEHSLPVNFYQVDPVCDNGRIYVIGGYNGVAFDTVYVSQIQADGTLGEWTATTHLPQADQGPGVTVHNDCIYVASASARAFYWARLQADGSISEWHAVPSPIPNAAIGYRLGLEAYEGYLYSLGGFHYDDVFYCKIYEDGSLGPWLETTTMPEARHHQSVHFYNDRLYIVGGVTSGNGILSTAYSASVQADGSIGAWRSEAALPHPLWQHNSLLVNGELFLFGGFTDYGYTVVEAVYHASIDPQSGAIGDWEHVCDVPGDYAVCMGAVYAEDAGGVAYLIGGGFPDLNTTSSVWSNRGDCPGDLDADGDVDQSDLGILLANYGQTCP